MTTTSETHSKHLEDKEWKMHRIVGAECELHCGCGNGNDDNSDTGGSQLKDWGPVSAA
jgi:hypothetical protein